MCALGNTYSYILYRWNGRIELENAVAVVVGVVGVGRLTCEARAKLVEYVGYNVCVCVLMFVRWVVPKRAVPNMGRRHCHMKIKCRVTKAKAACVGAALARSYITASISVCGCL